MKSDWPLPLFACWLVVSLTGCSDDPPGRSVSSKSATGTTSPQDAGDVTKITWLEIGDRTKPEAWLAALQTDNLEQRRGLETRFRALIELTSRVYLESPRMVANRIVQLKTMLNEAGEAESHTQLIEGFLSIPKKTRTGGERILSDLAAHYVNLRRSGLNREQALEDLRGGRPAIDIATLLDDYNAAAGADVPQASEPIVESDAQAPTGPLEPLERLKVDSRRIISIMAADDVLGYVKTAADLSPYDVPRELPGIVRISAEEIARVLCHGQKCGAVAFFDDRTRTVYVDDRLDLSKNLSARSFVVHEIVHYFHLLEGKLTADIDCDARLVLEQEAYEVQNLFLAREGSHQRIGTRLLQSMCRHEAR